MIVVRGIIPAYAGNTKTVKPLPVALRDHPRIRGEHTSANESMDKSARIIPAYAGNTN